MVCTGKHVTTCLLCMHTCHDDCRIEQDQDKYGCVAMNPEEPELSRHCMKCHQHCHWKQHSNTEYIVVYEPGKPEQKLVKDSLQRYSILESDIQRGEKLVAALKKNVADLLLQMISQVNLPGLNFYAQIDVRVGLQWEDFLENVAKKTYIFLGCIGLPTRVKWCKSEGVKDKLTAHSTSFWSVKGGKTM